MILITRKSYVVVIFIFWYLVLTIIVLLKLTIDIFIIFALNRNNDVIQNWYFFCHKINYFIVDCFVNLLKNICFNETKLKFSIIGIQKIFTHLRKYIQWWVNNDLFFFDQNSFVKQSFVIDYKLILFSQ